jgi:type III restriction enzyme
VKRTESEIWIIEAKGREDLDDPLKWERLQQWCADATAHDEARRQFHALFVREEDWEAYRLTSFGQLVTACG